MIKTKINLINNLLERVINFDIKKHKSIIILLIFLSFTIRLLGSNVISFDYIEFLKEWISHIRENGGIYAISTIYENTNCNYYLPYIFLLSIFSYIPIPDLYVIKLISIIFDYICAYGIYKIVLHFKNKQIGIIASLTFLFSPYVIIDSSMWGQCDVIYTTFIVWSLYFSLCKKDMSLGLFMWFIAFTFKLQAIFFAPVLFIFLLDNKIKVKDFKWCFIYGILLLIISAIIFDMRIFYPLQQSYLSQTSAYKPMISMMCANLYSIFDIISISQGTANIEIVKLLVKIITVLFIIFTLFLCLYFAHSKKDIMQKEYIHISLVFSFLCPFLMPLMHERYYYLAVVLLLVEVAIKDYKNESERISSVLFYMFIMIMFVISLINVYWKPSIIFGKAKDMFGFCYSQEIYFILSVITIAIFYFIIHDLLKRRL